MDKNPGAHNEEQTEEAKRVNEKAHTKMQQNCTPSDEDIAKLDAMQLTE